MIQSHNQKSFNYRLLIFVLAALFSIILSIPSFFQDTQKYPFFADKPKITLGLDLQGGLSLLLDVDTKVTLDSRFTTILREIKEQTDKQNILINRLRKQDDTITFTLLHANRENDVNKILADITGLQITKQDLNFTITMNEATKLSVQKEAIDQAISTIRNRLDKFGLTEPSVSREGLNQIRVEMPGVKTEEEEKRLINLISQNAKLEFMAVDEDLLRRVPLQDITEDIAERSDSILLPYTENEFATLPVKMIPILDGSAITNAYSTNDERGKLAVGFKLDTRGTEIFGDFTGRNIGKRLAIVLDKKIMSAPSISTRIGGGSGIITGNFTPQSVKDLSIALRSGALLAPVHIVEKRSVGPSLGADSIQASLIALISGFVLVVGFMILYYSIAGVFASCALIINLFLIIAIMALLGATLTLPGMAGIVLTVGVAVDANIIINERVREALKQGMGVVKALQVGYQNASRAIFDANITSLIASVLLYVYGTGAIKGFAITTGIGILASIITAIIGTHGIYLWLGNRIERSKNIPLWFGIKLDSNLLAQTKTKHKK